MYDPALAMATENERSALLIAPMRPLLWGYSPTIA